MHSLPWKSFISWCIAEISTLIASIWLFDWIYSGIVVPKVVAMMITMEIITSMFVRGGVEWCFLDIG